MNSLICVVSNKVPEGFHEEVSINETDRTGISNARRVARDADVVVMVLGEYGFQSGEGRSRTNLDLPGFQQELLEEVYKVNKNIVLVLMDNFGYGEVGVYGGGELRGAPTPNIDSIAAEGFQLTNYNLSLIHI